MIGARASPASTDDHSSRGDARVSRRHRRQRAVRALSEAHPRSLRLQRAGAIVALAVRPMRRLRLHARREVFRARRPALLQRRLLQVGGSRGWS